ncbi:MAG TPA: hypothetical protein VHD56_17540 [Tepidisphaeraceae bacterium]|jgi:hypothetical protein|nr:hypothetical protein [Tepidisphaeraceae bacterium]
MGQPRRFIMRIELTGPAKQKLSTLSDKHGMTQVAMMSRLVEWYAQQDELIQAAVMGHYPSDIEPDVAKLILKRMVN